MSTNPDLAWERLRRGTAVTGLMVVPLLFAPTIAISTLGEPPFDATEDQAVAFLATSANTSWAQTAMVVQSVAALGLLWWAVALTQLMRRAEGEPPWRSTVALASVVIFTAYVVLESHWQTAVQLDDLDPGLALFAFDAGNIGFADSWLALASFAVASGWVIVRTRMLPPTLGWLALVSGVGFVAARLDWTSWVWFLPYALFWTWVIAVCVTLLRRPTSSTVTTPSSLTSTTTST